MNLKDIHYNVPEHWYAGVYADVAPVKSSARSFSMTREGASECWLLIHGYRGFPGELVRPAVDLFEAGFDVYVPRLPGHGTSADDFIASSGKDWVAVCSNALADLKKKYRKVNLLGHSMGSAIAACLGCRDPEVGKIVYVSPSFENKDMGPFARAALAVCSLFTPRIRCSYHPSSRYHFHYEGAPCDYDFYGNEYWRFYFTKKLPEYYRILKDGLRAVSASSSSSSSSSSSQSSAAPLCGSQPSNPAARQLVVYPLLDRKISAPSVTLYKRAAGVNANIVTIENGTHCLMYDKDPSAENAAIAAIVNFALS